MTKPAKQPETESEKSPLNITIHRKVRKWAEDMAAARGQTITAFIEGLIRDEFVRLFGPIRPEGYSQRGGTPGVTPQEKPASSLPPSDEAAILAAVVKEVENDAGDELSSPPSGVGEPASQGAEPPRPSSPESKPRHPAREERERKKT